MFKPLDAIHCKQRVFELQGIVRSAGDTPALDYDGYPQSIRRLGFDPRDLALILHTHAHYDHVGGTRALVVLTGARTALGAADAAIVNDRPELTEADLAGMTFHQSFAVDQLLEDGQTIRLGLFAIRCLHTPGHTPGAMSYGFDVTCQGRTRRVGLHGGPGLASLSHDYLRRHHLPLTLRADYRAALKRLREEPIDLHLATHPGQNRLLAKRARLDTDPEAFVNPADWPTYLDQLEAIFTARFG